jgi:choline dehydrogenase
MNVSEIENTLWDYVVVGAGSAGCVVANRLSADPATKVLLLESGGSDKTIYIQMPAATYVKAIGNPKFDWNYAVEPDPTTDGQPKTISRGRVMGGSSSINGMIYIRGFPQDYDGWAARGNVGWAWQDVLPLFKRQENNQRGASAYHGAGGPLSVSDIREVHPLAKIFIAAAQARGIPFNDDLNGPRIGGLGYAQATQRNGWRNSSARAFIDPVRKRPNLTVLTHATARRLIFAGNRIAGVEFEHRRRIGTLKVHQEVVVSAGAIASPQLLLVSGVGDRRRLAALGIPVVADNPAVGQNFQDHPGINMTYGVSIPTFNDEMALWKQVLHGANWLFRGRGPGSTPDAHIVGFVKSDPDEPIPDIQVHVTPAGYALAGEGSELVLKESSFTIVVSVCRPKSTGSIDIGSADPGAPPIIRHRLFADDDDLTRLAKGVAVVRAIVEAPPLTALVTRAMDPVLHTAVGDALKDHVRSKARDIAHPSCSVRMGIDDSAALMPDLRVKGVDGVRVADASVMPVVTSGNLNAPCMMIGEKCAALILGMRNEPASRPSDSPPRESQFTLAPSQS